MVMKVTVRQRETMSDDVSIAKENHGRGGAPEQDEDNSGGGASIYSGDGSSDEFSMAKEIHGLGQVPMREEDNNSGGASIRSGGGSDEVFDSFSVVAHGKKVPARFLAHDWAVAVVLTVIFSGGASQRRMTSLKSSRRASTSESSTSPTSLAKPAGHSSGVD